MKVLYFAWLRQKIGRSEEDIAPPPSVADVSGLVAYLRTRGPQYDAAFRDLTALRCAVNQEHAGFEAAIAPGDEIAFFPPVTGG